MLKAIQRFYQTRIQPQSEAITDKEATEHALMLATAALMLEVTRADKEDHPAEKEAVERALTQVFSLSDAERAELIGLADRETREATSLYQFTHLIDKGFSQDQKRHVVELLWRVVFADRVMEKHEEQLVRRVAGLIHVPHKAFIDAKVRVKRELEEAGEL